MSALADEPVGADAVALAQRIAELEERLAAAERRHAVLRRAEVLRDRLLAVATSGGDFALLAATIAQLLGRPCAVTGAELTPIAGHDPSRNAKWTPEIAAPRLREDLTAQELLRRLRDDESVLLPPALHLDARRRLLVGPPTAFGARVWLAERPGAFTALDRLAIRHATTAMALLGCAAVPASRQDLLAELLSGTAPEGDLERHARSAGLDVADGVVVLCAATPVGELLTALAAADRPVLAGERPEGVAVLVAVDPGLPLREARAAILEVAGPGVAASDVVFGVRDLPGAWVDARTAAAAARVSGTRAPEYAALGPARLLLGSGDRGAVDGFLRDVLGGLLDDAEGSAEMLLATLAAAFDASHSVGRAAEALGVHENTVRYRLKRAEERLGCDLGRPEQRLAVEVAILVLRLRGDERVAAPAARRCR